MQTGNLAAGAGDAQAGDRDLGRIHLLSHLIQDGAIALARGADRIAAGAQVDGSQDGVVSRAHQNGFGGGGADVKTQDAVVSGLHPAGCHGFKFHLVCELL